VSRHRITCGGSSNESERAADASDTAGEPPTKEIPAGGRADASDTAGEPPAKVLPPEP